MAKLKSTNGSYPPPVPKTRLTGIVFFIVIHLAAFVGSPLYIYYFGVTPAELALFLFFTGMTGMAITMGYHRLFAHTTYKTNNFIRFLLLFFGAATFEQSALKWSSQHRQHHIFTDTDQDPYNINKGFWYAHAGWILFWKHKVNYENVPDLKECPMVMHQHKWYTVWSFGAGVVLPFLLGCAIGRPLGAAVLLLALRMVIVIHSAFFINSFAHTFGTTPYDASISAKDNLIGAFLTNGEGYHNFHHRFPHDYRNGIKWYHWDPTKWCIAACSKLGWTWDLKETSKERIEAAQKTNFQPPAHTY